jgi:hypothetical protein
MFRFSICRGFVRVSELSSLVVLPADWVPSIHLWPRSGSAQHSYQISAIPVQLSYLYADCGAYTFVVSEISSLLGDPWPCVILRVTFL